MTGLPPPSRTALAAAAHRAIHQDCDLPRVFEDPLAAAFAGEDRPAAGLLGGRAMRAFICARSRLAEDALAAAVADGVTQYLLLGAGLDSFAWRNPYPGLQVVEADHPQTQTWKLQRLAARGQPPRATFAPVDLQRGALLPALAAAGLDLGRRVFVSWLGVTPYLESETVMATLEALASLNAGVEVVFDYGPAAGSLTGRMRDAHERRAAKVAAAGEPWVSGFDPPDLIGGLAHLGFSQIEDLGPPEINARFYDGRADGLRVLAGRVMRART
jgi:methyltransferase (TIGR00027 family)